MRRMSDGFTRASTGSDREDGIDTNDKVVSVYIEGTAVFRYRSEARYRKIDTKSQGSREPHPTPLQIRILNRVILYKPQYYIVTEQ